MPNIKSAKKRMRTSEEGRVRNVALRTLVKSCRRKFRETVEGEDKAATEKAYKEYCSALDNAAKKGVIKKNTASRRKARAADAIRASA